MFAALVLNVTAPSSYCYCTIVVNKGAVTVASRVSTIADLGLRSTRQAEPYIPWSRFTHTLSCYTLISTVRALVCATAPPVRSPAKASAILNESVTAVTASRFSPVLTRYVKMRVVHAPGMPGTFSTHVPWCISGSLTRGFLWSRWRGKRSRHSRHMRNPQYYVSGKRPIRSLVLDIYNLHEVTGLPALRCPNGNLMVYKFLIISCIFRFDIWIGKLEFREGQYEFIGQGGVSI